MYFAAIGHASLKGIIVKGSGILEKASKIDAYIFDKTGTLSVGNLKVTSYTSEETLRLASIGEQHSSHPVARAIRSANDTQAPIEGFKEIPGSGLEYTSEGNLRKVGSSTCVGVHETALEAGTTAIYVSKNANLVGNVILSDEIRETSHKLRDLFKSKILAIVSGDSSANAQKIAMQLSFDKHFGECLPEDKITRLEEFIDSGMAVAFIGDGINDGPVLKRADIGIAMGRNGSDLALESADVVLMDENLERIGLLERIGKGAGKLVVQNIVLALGIKIIVMVLSVFGLGSMWMAVFADVGVALLAILNAIRIRNVV